MEAKYFDAYLKDKLCVVDGYYNMQQTGKGWSAEEYGNIGIYTGDWTTDDNGNQWFQIRTLNPATTGLWWINGDIKSATPDADAYSVKDCQDVLDDILHDNKYIMQNLLVSSLYLETMKKQGITTGTDNVTVAEMEENVAFLYQRLKEREKALVNDNLIQTTGTTKTYESGAYAACYSSLESLVKSEGVGAIPVAVYYIGTALVSAVVGAFVYYKLKAMKTEANYDLALSNEFMDWFNDQSQETQTIVLNQLKATGDSAWREAVDSEKGKSTWKKIKTWGIVAAGVLGLVWFNNNIDTKKVRKNFFGKKSKSKRK
jgi:hypothetical protein